VVCNLSPAAVDTGTVGDADCTFTATQVATLKAGGMYFNIHTVVNPRGEIRGQINLVLLLRAGFEHVVVPPQSRIRLPLASGLQTPCCVRGIN
jgi:hypothetical protein